eukprot:4512595-Prymnesium_polylepis.1
MPNVGYDSGGSNPRPHGRLAFAAAFCPLSLWFDTQCQCGRWMLFRNSERTLFIVTEWLRLALAECKEEAKEHPRNQNVWQCGVHKHLCEHERIYLHSKLVGHERSKLWEHMMSVWPSLTRFLKTLALRPLPCRCMTFGPSSGPCTQWAAAGTHRTKPAR